MTPLSSPGWYPANRNALNRWLTRGDVQRPFSPCAVFDWDDTCIFGDIGDAVFRHQLATQQLRFSADSFRGHLGSFAEPQLTRLAQLAYDNFGAMTGSAGHTTFQCAMGMFHDALSAVDRPRSLATLAGLLAGYTEAEVAVLTEETYTRGDARPVGTGTWNCRRHDLEHTFPDGLRSKPEVAELMLGLERADIPVTVVSASSEYVVRAMAKQLGVAVHPDRIFGIRQQRDAHGRFTPDRVPDANYPLTYRHGKSRLITEHLAERPVLVAGDADNDVPMLTGFAETEIRLVMNRNAHDDEIGALYAHAHVGGEFPEGRPLTLLQGRDERTGTLRPAMETLCA